ncbi:hypothetical protein PHLGIDRAFT_32694 [Phlebiopsis gigantea 11061_1 CR5-6]|uniref:Uncharacterized protein n=1 Tax=Phlebiopsis gigantea (strain 11061_1 CR5-6) TaxID=745531 RepID=A0A0C3P4B1_PHLG1|nr:hypothetical protein PHLGIDRAFT_32694 [Phlebiopsis gigantea 11061_1 CR5-6]
MVSPYALAEAVFPPRLATSNDSEAALGQRCIKRQGYISILDDLRSAFGAASTVEPRWARLGNNSSGTLASQPPPPTMPALVVQQQQDGETQRNQSPTQPSHTIQPRKTSNPTVKAKKDATIRANVPPPPAKQDTVASQSQMKKLSRKSSKPIINWFQRKLAGTVRTRRASDGDALRARGVAGTRPATLKEQRRRSSVPAVPPILGSGKGEKVAKVAKGQQRPLSAVASTKRNTISLNGSEDFSSVNDDHTVDSTEDYRSSLARESLWSPTSLSAREADEDASVRPLPPSAPPSPSPSHSSSSYLSDPRTFASMAASTKPTTVLSIDLTGGMAHIAQAPPTPTVPSYRLGTHARSHSTAPSTGGSITFSALPTTASPSPPSSSAHGPSSRSSLQPITLHAPQHTAHHPRNNPRPSSPPSDDASVLTLASSAFGFSGTRQGMGGRRSVADDSISHFSGAAGLGDSTSHFLLGELEDEERLLEALDRDGDVDASVRALRPRSSRRGSWESEASKWSAHFGNGTGPPSTPSALKDKSLWTSASLRTGARSVNFTEDELSQERSMNGHTDEFGAVSEESRIEGEQPASILRNEDTSPSTEDIISTPSTSSMSMTNEEGTGSRTPKEKGLDTPKVSSMTLEDIPPPIPSANFVERPSFDKGSLPTPNQADKHSMLSSSTDTPIGQPVSKSSIPLTV